MNLFNVEIIAPYQDISGYGEASRNYIKAMNRMGLGLKLTKLKYTSEVVLDKEIDEIISKTDAYISIHIHLPDNIVYLNRQNYNIIIFFWETDILPKTWVQILNKNYNEIWAPSKFIKDACLRSGVTIPIYVIYSPLEIDDTEDIIPLPFLNEIKNYYKFYSIFQWTERKAPLSLLKAYLTEFDEDEEVVLVLKTYRINFSNEEKNYIKSQISQLKQDLNLKKYPKILFLGDSLTQKEIYSLHKYLNCFVLLQRSEGFGYPHLEAALFGRPVITTNYPSVNEFLNSYLANCIETPVGHMPWIPYYNGKMKWAEPDIIHAKKLMRYVFENKITTQKYIGLHNICSYNTVAKKIYNRLEEIKKDE